MNSFQLYYSKVHSEKNFGGDMLELLSATEYY